MDPGAAVSGPAQDHAGPRHIRVGVFGMGEKPAVVDADHARPPSGWHHVIGAVDDFGTGEPTVSARNVEASPAASCDPGGQRQSDLSGHLFGFETQEVRLQVKAGVGTEVMDEMGDGGADTGAVSVKWADVNGDPHQMRIMPALRPRWAVPSG